jgi:FxsC-like protein
MMAEPDRPSSADGPELPELPELRFLRESGSTLESMAPVPSTGAAAVRLRAEAVRRGLLPAPDTPEADLAAIGDELELDSPRFDLDTHSGRLREAAQVRGLLQASERSHRPVSAGATDGSRPVFFLSYAPEPADDQGGQGPDLWETKLYDDLCDHVRALADLRPGERAGFMDRGPRHGDEWPWRMSQALATCRVFVPLYSRRYFKSEHCGREWFAFSRRALNHAARGAGRVETIIPALWIPVRDAQLPEATRAVQFAPNDFGSRYAEHGFYGIMKVRRWREDYEEAVYLLARRIVAAADASPVEPETPMQYESLPPAFGEDRGTGPGDRLLRITVIAPRGDELPDGRDPVYYGNDFRAWNPYRQSSVRPLADHAADLARSLSYIPDVGDLSKHEAGLFGSQPPSGPEVLLIDPWAALDPDCQETLQRLDQTDMPWVQVVVVWNERDAQMQADADRLRSALEAALPRKLREGRATSASAVRGVPSLDDLGTVLPRVIAAAGRHYLRYASAHVAERQAE